MKVAVLSASLALVACSGVRSSVVVTGTPALPYDGPVAVRATRAPTSAELGIVQVAGPRTLEDLLPEFKRRVAELGGSLGIVDRISSRFEMELRNDVQTYSCGTSTAPRTCTRTVRRWQEILTVQMLGRAFRP